jgi:deoxyribose-phosphate aldolase
MLAIPDALRTPGAFAALFDHTLLKPDATPAAIKALVREAVANGFKGVCVNPCYVNLAARELAAAGAGSRRPLAVAVVGFPLGAHRTDVKMDEALRAAGDGADELDMVVNLGLYLGGEGAAVRHDLAAVVRAGGKVPVKVILETGYLTPAQIEELTRWSVDAGAAFVKTSTGFGPRGASVDDVRLMAKTAAGRAQVKASGGIRTLNDALAMAAAGATRLGASASVRLLQDFREELAEER